MTKKNVKDTILDAAEKVVAANGLANTTVEAIADAAGISKGGIFYHFPSKKDILFNLIERFEKRFNELRATIAQGLPDSPVRSLKAAVLAFINHPAHCSSKASNIVGLLDDIEMQKKIASMKKKLFVEVSKGIKHQEKAALALLVADGLWVMEMFGNSLYSDKLKNKVITELLRTIDGFCE